MVESKNQQLTAETITDEQIEQLMRDAAEDGDESTQEQCVLALEGSEIARREARRGCAHAINEARVLYKIETRTTSSGRWTDQGIALDSRSNRFATESEAEAAIEDLRNLGAEWAEAEYRVVEC